MLTPELRKRFHSELAKARVDRAVADSVRAAPSAYSTHAPGFAASLLLVKVLHNAGTVAPTVPVAQSFGDAVTRRLTKRTPEDGARFSGVGGLSQPANFEKALQATQAALARPKTMIRNMRGTMR